MFNTDKELRRSFHDKKLTLYLGAGVSMGSNLPSWDKLVLGMYFNKISEQEMDGWHPFSNYLYAIAEWYLASSKEPVEITARKLRKYYKTQNEGEFLDDLYQTLYSNFLIDGNRSSMINKDFLRINNPTLDAVAKLCESSLGGVRAVITYNYDNLLEIALDDYKYKPVFSSNTVDSGLLPIYHVHGYVPLDRSSNSSKGDEIIFTEDQYHRVAENPYYWSNLVQMQLLSSSTGLMIGLSLSDMNMRRLLDAVRNSPINSKNYALLKMPDTSSPGNDVIEKIQEKAIEYLDKFKRSGIKSEQMIDNGIFYPKPGKKSSYPSIKSSKKRSKGQRYQYEIAGIIEQVRLLAKDQQQYVLEELGVTPIWFNEFSDIPRIIKKIYT